MVGLAFLNSDYHQLGHRLYYRKNFIRKTKKQIRLFRQNDLSYTNHYIEKITEMALRNQCKILFSVTLSEPENTCANRLTSTILGANHSS
jgi:hypothetical protein